MTFVDSYLVRPQCFGCGNAINLKKSPVITFGTIGANGDNRTAPTVPMFGIANNVNAHNIKAKKLAQSLSKEHLVGGANDSIFIKR